MNELEKIFANEDLEKFTSTYPYCSIAHFYLLDQYKKKGSPAFEKQAEKTALFFQDVRWLDWRLNVQEVQKVQGVQEVVVPEVPIVPEVPEVEVQKVLEAQEVSEVSEVPVTIISPAEEIKKEQVLEPVPKDEPIAFEPLHTVDYFASQGIKITEEPVATDKLGKQMKSFTEWLKSMKKIHADKTIAADEQTDQRIQFIAEGSNTNAEVVTEALAEVLEKQGKYDKAIEIYNKLSLIYPPKSAYFAAKIDRLKTS